MRNVNCRLGFCVLFMGCFAGTGFAGALHVFTKPGNGTNQDGANPFAGLALSGGALCGTTVNGGAQGVGTAFYLMPDASVFSAFRSFANPPDANNSQGTLAFSGSSFFGASSGGGTNGGGTIFAGQTNGTVSVVHSFAAANADTATNSGGASPGAQLALSGGTIYGTTTAGGASANGTIFSLNTNGPGFAVLHDFTALDSVAGTNVDGAIPWGGLVLSGNTLYGTTSAGGAGGVGTVFSINTNGSNFTTLHSFTPMDTVTATNADGAIPFGGLVLSNGTLYGVTTAGGFAGRGAIFAIQTNRLGFTVLHHFSPIDPALATNNDGAAPCSTLALSGNVLYGTAPAGGASASGTVYSVETDGTQFKTLYNFTAVDSSSGTNVDGAFPIAGLLVAGNSLYGTAFGGGPGSAGTVFGLPIPAPPAVITNIVTNPNRSLTLFFVGGPNSTNIVQVTTNVAASAIWLNVSTNVADADGGWQFTESSATNSTRFYRSYAP